VSTSIRRRFRLRAGKDSRTAGAAACGIGDCGNAGDADRKIFKPKLREIAAGEPPVNC